ncbi:MAG TPA: hypothetical protein VHO84_14580 [Syntrophorhabdaceae bacterium]|nr:hypothetical protein [Syntrophorhabdaceae bacterium]
MKTGTARTLSTADLARTVEEPERRHENNRDRREEAFGKGRQQAAQNEQLEPLFMPRAARDFRSRWNAIQTGFVDDPKKSVNQADELVAEVMKNLAEMFSSERSRLETQTNRSEKMSTEELRIAFRRYRSFFERLLSFSDSVAA